MSRQLTEKDIRRAKEIYLSRHNEILIPVENHNSGSVFRKEDLCWDVTKRWYDWKKNCQALTADEAIKIINRWINARKKVNDTLNNAIEFATERHRGQYRKGTVIPYIVHPLEVMQILNSMASDVKLMIAGVLHDTVEDTDTTLDEIRERFGTDVAKLIASNSEDKSKSWDERKQHTIDELANANERVKKLILADKLANIRAIAQDYEKLGDSLWDRFNAPKEKQAWYYSGILDAIYDLQFISECEKAYWEFTELYKDVFVKYYIDRENEVVYQASANGDVYCLKKGNPQWKNTLDEISKQIAEVTVENDDGERHYFSVNSIPENTELISRKEAELTEDIWNKPFWECCAKDIMDGEYSIFYSQRRSVTVHIFDSRLKFFCEDFGKECKVINGSDEYRFLYSLDDENTYRLLVQLRIIAGIEKSFECIIKEEFGKDSGPALFEEFCKKVNVKYEFYNS